MPELPEVEVVRRGLQIVLKNQTAIQSFEFKRADLRFKFPKKKLQLLVNQPILQVQRRAKYLLFETSKGFLLSHLGMTGSWRVEAAKFTARKHDHVVLRLLDGRNLVYCDPRRFGFIDYVALKSLQTHPRLKNLGPEPLSQEFNPHSLWKSLRGKKTSLKTALMDQAVVVGVGNIYASEALFLAKIHPRKVAAKLSLQACEVLVPAIKKVLTDAIAAGGSSISDFKQISGQDGYFQNRHQVYDRDGQPCLICNTPLRRAVITGRSTFWCPQCQKK